MESCICGAFTNLNQYMWNLVNHKSKSMSISHIQPYIFPHVFHLVSAMKGQIPDCQGRFASECKWNDSNTRCNLQNHKMVPGHQKKSTCENTFTTWNYTNGNLQKIHNLDIVLAGLTTTSRSEHVLHSSSLFLIDFLLGTSRGASLFTVASPQQNRAASWRLISWSAGQAQQNMLDQPEFDYVPQFNFN